ncbi:MAG: major capsid protein, partial [Acutalibacteraceae bacterium]
SPGTGGSTLVYGYKQLKSPSTAAFRELNNEYDSNEAKTAKKSVELKTFGGKAQVDRVLQQASAQKEIEFQLKQKILGTRNLFHYSVINGGTTGNTKAFDGLSKMLTGQTTEYLESTTASPIDLSSSDILDANYKRFMDMLDDFLSAFDGKPGMFLGNSKIIAKLKAVARRAGYITQTENSFGTPAPGYDNIVFVDMGNYYDGSKTVPAIPITDNGLTDLYAVTLGLDAFHGVSLKGDSIIHTYLPKLDEPGAVKDVEVEMTAAVALKNTLKSGVFRNIKVV